MSDAGWALQQSVFSTLESALAPTRVYDDVPPNTKMPYVVVGDDTAAQWDSALGRGEDLTLTIHAWSNYRGKREVKLLMAQIKDALHDQALSVAGHQLVQLTFEFVETFVDADGVTRHGVIRFRALTLQSVA